MIKHRIIVTKEMQDKMAEKLSLDELYFILNVSKRVEEVK